MRLLGPALLLAAFLQPAAIAAQTRPAAPPAAPPAAAPSAPATPEVTDERCLLAMIALSNANDQTAQRMGQAGTLFFAGRLKGRDPNFDFTRLKSMAATMSAQTAQADLQQRCGPMVSGSLDQLQAALGPPASAQSPAKKAPATQPPKK
jgi:hypothetical protein